MEKMIEVNGKMLYLPYIRTKCFHLSFPYKVSGYFTRMYRNVFSMMFFFFLGLHLVLKSLLWKIVKIGNIYNNLAIKNTHKLHWSKKQKTLSVIY